MAQYDKRDGQMSPRNDDVFEVVMIADQNGDISTESRTPNGFYSFNNFADAISPFPADTTERAVFALRVKPGSDANFYVDDFTLANVDNNMCAFTWYMMPTFNEAVTWVEIGSTGIECSEFTGSTTVTGGILAHGGILTAKESTGLTSHMSNAKFTDGGIVVVLCAKSLTNNSGLWYSCTLTN